jgi:ABC-type phosphate transport system ATPase subunit
LFSLKNNIHFFIMTYVTLHGLGQAKRLSHETHVMWNDGEGGTLIAGGQTDVMFNDAGHPLARRFLSEAFG